MLSRDFLCLSFDTFVIDYWFPIPTHFLLPYTI